jgi:hypothetical protein
MNDLEHFARGLGSHAKHYTPEQLKQLHIEVRKLAEVLLAIHDSRRHGRLRRTSSPQPSLDQEANNVHQ